MRMLRTIIACNLAIGCALAPCVGAELTDLQRKRLSCSAWDAHVMTQIEDAGRSGAASGERLFEIYLRQQQARSLCGAGRYVEAFEIFSRIDIDDDVAAPTREACALACLDER